jgi:hypothetical protein
MDKNVIVGHEDYLGTACGAVTKGTGFIFSWPGGPLNPFSPLPGDCTSSAEDINDNYGIVGYSSPGTPALQQALALNVPGLGGGYVNLNTLIGEPWVRLTDASGIDDGDNIVATDGGAAPTRVYIIN